MVGSEESCPGLCTSCALIALGKQSTESSDTSWSQSDVQSSNDYGYGQGQALPNPYNFQYGNPQSISLDPYGWHRFFEFRTEADRGNSLPPFEAVHVNRRKIRRATEAAGISYTYASANSFASYFVDFLLHPHEKRKEVTVYGSGEAKAVLNYKQDVAAYTIRAATDPRAANQIMIYRQQENIASQLELTSAWEKKTGCTLKRIHVQEQEI
ncbi:hypothetical protein ACLB2K_022321 [Fragaria x ananassa]